MKTIDLFDLNVKLTDIGKVKKINHLEYQLIYSVSYSWHTPSHNSWDPIVTTPHPRKPLGIVLGFDKTIVEKIGEIYINLNILGFYSGGPSGPYAEVYGNIGERHIDVRAFFNGTAARYDEIEDVKIGKYLFHAHYGLHEFYMAGFRLKD